MARNFVLTLAMLLNALVCANAQQQLGASRTALATVVDARGRAVVDIEADDFVVRELGVPREVLSVRVADYPIALVLDNGEGAGASFDAIRQAAARFIGRVGNRPIAVIPADPPTALAGFDDDRATVMDRLAMLQATASPGELLQGVVNAAHAISDYGSPFSAIVIVSARPLGSVPGELLTPVLESHATVHAIVSRENADGDDAAVRPRETLQALAEETRGQFTIIYAASSYQVVLDRLADRLAPELMVEYIVPVNSESGNDVQLGVRIPGARVNGRGVTR